MTDNKKVFFSFKVQGESWNLIIEKRPIDVTESIPNRVEFFTPLHVYCVLYALCLSNGYFTTSGGRFFNRLIVSLTAIDIFLIFNQNIHIIKYLVIFLVSIM